MEKQAFPISPIVVTRELPLPR